jgi:membrane carboxypeptidase/penicillin-binding protein
LPKEEFTVPEGIIQVKVDAQTGDVPTNHTQKVISEYFVDGNAPGQVAKPDENSNIASLTSQEPRILKTQIITGNPDLSSSRPSTETEGTSGMDELLREDL